MASYRSWKMIFQNEIIHCKLQKNEAMDVIKRRFSFVRTHNGSLTIYMQLLRFHFRLLIPIAIKVSFTDSAEGCNLLCHGRPLYFTMLLLLVFWLAFLYSLVLIVAGKATILYSAALFIIVISSTGYVIWQMHFCLDRFIHIINDITENGIGSTKT